MGTFIGRSKNIQNVIALLEATHKAGRVGLLWGPPGIGKTALVRALAAKHNLPLYILIPSTMDPTDVNGLPALKEIVLPNGEKATITENTLQYWSEALLRDGKGILFFDEASTAVPATQAALLSVLQGRLVGRHTLSDEIWMVAAANNADDAADGWELAPPMANRFFHIEYTMDNNDFLEGMTVGWNKDNITGRELDERAKIVSFLQSYPTLISKMPKNSAEAGKAWPSPRTWDALADTLPYLDDKSSRSLAIKGAVGDAAAQQFLEFERSLDLPSYDEVMGAPEKLDWKKRSSSEVYVILSMILGRMTPENIEKSAAVFSAAAEVGEKTDVCTALAYPLMDKVRLNAPSREKAAIILGTVLKKYAGYLKDAKLRP